MGNRAFSDGQVSTRLASIKIFIRQRFGDSKTYAPMGLKGHDGIDLRTPLH